MATRSINAPVKTLKTGNGAKSVVSTTLQGSWKNSTISNMIVPLDDTEETGEILRSIQRHTNLITNKEELWKNLPQEMQKMDKLNVPLHAMQELKYQRFVFLTLDNYMNRAPHKGR